MSPAGARKSAPRSLMTRAVAMLARREHSRAELARKLAQYLEPEQDAAEVTRVLDELERRQLLSDARFAGALVRSRSTRYGDARLRQELKLKGVTGEAAADALGALGGSEFERALALWRRRFDAAPTSREERARQGRYLQARGFSLSTIRRVLGSAHDEDESI